MLGFSTGGTNSAVCPCLVEGVQTVQYVRVSRGDTNSVVCPCLVEGVQTVQCVRV